MPDSIVRCAHCGANRREFTAWARLADPRLQPLVVCCLTEDVPW